MAQGQRNISLAQENCRHHQCRETPAKTRICVLWGVTEQPRELTGPSRGSTLPQAIFTLAQSLADLVSTGFSYPHMVRCCLCIWGAERPPGTHLLESVNTPSCDN